MKRLFTLLLVTTLIVSLFACGNSSENEPTTQAITTEVTTDAPTEAPTDAPTAAPTEAPTEAPTKAPTTPPTEAPAKKFDIKSALSTGYWISGGEHSITVYTYIDEKMHYNYYKNQNGTYVKMDGPGYSNFCIPEIYEDSFMMYGEGGMTTMYYFTSDSRIIKSEADHYSGNCDIWINYSSIPDYNTVISDMNKYR